MILGILLALGLFGGFILGIPMFVIWVAHEHSQAKQFRYLMVLAASQPKQSGWLVTYRGEGKTKTITADGPTEEKMLLDLVKNHGIGYDKIISSVKQ